MEKFEIGSQWKTRAGWRAVIVAVEEGTLKVWYDTKMDTMQRLRKCGYFHDIEKKSDFDLIEPWKEPVVHEGWLDIFQAYEGKLKTDMYDTETECKAAEDRETIARIKIKFTEGEGL